MGRLNDRILRKQEVQALFWDVLNMDQIENIKVILEILGKHLVLDRTMAEQLTDGKIGMSYWQKAVNKHLITELEVDNEKGFSYYYQLKGGGYEFLKLVKLEYSQMPLIFARDERDKLLTINAYLANNDFEEVTYVLDAVVAVVDQQILYFEEESKDAITESVALKFDVNIEDVYELYQFTKLKKKNYMSSKTKGSELFQNA